MCKALRELMKDEIQEELANNTFETMVAALKNLIVATGKTADEAMNMLLIPASDRDKYRACL